MRANELIKINQFNIGFKILCWIYTRVCLPPLYMLSFKCILTISQDICNYLFFDCSSSINLFSLRSVSSCRNAIAKHFGILFKLNRNSVLLLLARNHQFRKMHYTRIWCNIVNIVSVSNSSVHGILRWQLNFRPHIKSFTISLFASFDLYICMCSYNRHIKICVRL